MPKQIIIAYVPVVQRGYLQMFDAFPDAHTLYLVDKYMFGDEIVDYLRKDLRQLKPSETKNLLSGLDRFDSLEVFNENNIASLDISDHEIIMPDEDISHLIAEKFTKAKITFYGVFLRWDRRSLENINARHEDEITSDNVTDVAFINKAVDESQTSTDIWRRVGAVLVASDGKIIDFASNHGEPTKYSPLMEGDPRNIFNRGVGIEMSLFTHAEAVLIARAAYHGNAIHGARIYVTDYPCPACAKLIAHSGIKCVYYKDGYAVLDGKRILDEYNVKQIRVQFSDPNDNHPEVWVPYKKS